MCASTQTKTACRFMMLTATGATLVVSVAPNASPKGHAAPKSRTTRAASLTSVIERLIPSVVFIGSRAADGATEAGTGFCIRKDGLIATAAHLTDGDKVDVGVYQQGRYVRTAGVVVDRDRDADICLVRVRSNVPPVLLDTGPVRRGEEIGVLGFPYGPAPNGELAAAASRGIISGLRASPAKANASQVEIDAAVAFGSSGSPVFRAGTGVVVGMITSSLAPRENASESLPFSFAAPSLLIQRLARRQSDPR